MPLPTGGTEPIGSRIIEVPEDPERVELRDRNSGFIAYAPPGSLAKGQLLVATGGDGKTIACTICHGPTLKGLVAMVGGATRGDETAPIDSAALFGWSFWVGEVPGIAGQSPVNIARQLHLFATGERAGTWAVLMKGVVEKLTNDDIVAISACVAALEP
jgi:cytochrome c553